jgi:hypothetical protein
MVAPKELEISYTIIAKAITSLAIIQHVIVYTYIFIDLPP